ncbi:hypothetical protein GPECTOR_15g500 [Gonium pectorale]|uniref:Uncharacterized protein n=1 Tax=Gonium pectorale TaxID=33097 RepID=A0A150GLY3_GONPE|nr:hypothetical protein GPECTOR_15g500 [Gonium pectorale]|eukprot:KXZ50814.1 hypothetical protein GPECTOR_15g500 [Gonium pectorale]
MDDLSAALELIEAAAATAAATAATGGSGGAASGAGAGGGSGGSGGSNSSNSGGAVSSHSHSAALLLFSRGGAQLAFEAGDVGAAAEDLARAAELCGGVLRGEGPLWESRKFMSSGSGAPDLSPSLWYQLGCAYARCGRHRDAVSALQRAASIMPDHPVFLHELAKACQAAGDPTSAVAHFSAVLRLQPRNARALLRRGLALRCLRRYEEAAADLLAARRLDPGNPLMQLDMRALGNVSYIELCAPGEEDDMYVITKY